MDANTWVGILDSDEANRRNRETLLARSLLGAGVVTFAAREELLASPHLLESLACLLVELGPRGALGIDMLRALGERPLRPAVLALATAPDTATAVEAMRLGARDVLLRPLRPARVVERVREAVDGHRRDRPRVLAYMDAAARCAALTPREREILSLVSLGRRSREVATALGITAKAVEACRSRIMQKTRASSLAQLVRMWVEVESLSARGLVPPARSHPLETRRRVARDGASRG